MTRKFVSIALTVSTFVLSGATFDANEISEPTKSQAKMTFVCATDIDPPTLFAYTPGEVTLKPLFRWYPEYLLPNQPAAAVCQQVAQKLQQEYNSGKRKFFAAETVENRTDVCLVSREDEKCNSQNSQQLFSLNANYDTTCVMNNGEPIDCFAVNTRGVFSLPAGTYEPSWWPF